MKVKDDPRHQRRIHVMQDLFAWNFQPDTSPKTEDAKGIKSHLIEIDESIKKGAPNWPIEQINKIDLAILRLATYELLIVKQAPVKVIIDEAVEIAKEYGSDSSPSFVNGVLGNLVTLQNP